VRADRILEGIGNALEGFKGFLFRSLAFSNGQDLRDGAKGVEFFVAVTIYPERGAFGQAADAFVKGVRTGDMAPEEKADVASRLGGGVNAATGQQGFDLGGDSEGFAIIGIVEGFDAEGVAGQEYTLAAGIPDEEGIHSAEFIYHSSALSGVEVEEDFGIAVGTELVAFIFEFAAEGAVVVDFSIEDDNVGAIGTVHGLGSGFGEVNDG